MCCACNGGTFGYTNYDDEEIEAMEQSLVDYKECLTKNGAESLANRFECDMKNSTYDTFKYLAQCFDEQGNWFEGGEDGYCSTAKNEI